ncbi:MAG: spermidine synthase [Verrucomicrobiales bacterium]|jgi:spermidine synthase
MKPTVKVAETIAPDGAVFGLYKHDGQFMLYMNQRQVMSTILTHSELMLADIGCSHIKPHQKARVLIGGLGLGYSLRRALEMTGADAKIIVAELLPEVVRWNHEHLDGLNDKILADSRTQIAHGDVYDLILKAATKGPTYESILLDVDDGPSSLIQPQNGQLYNGSGLDLLKAALSPNGRAAIWAAEAEPRLLKAIRKAGFNGEEIACAKHANAKRQHHRIYLAERRQERQQRK